MTGHQTCSRKLPAVAAVYDRRLSTSGGHRPPLQLATLALSLLLVVPDFARAALDHKAPTPALAQPKPLAATSAKSNRDSSKTTIAHTLLELELEGTAAPLLWQKLDALVERASIAFGPPRPQELEPATAQRFFRVVDETLIDGGAIFPPGGKVELLQDALKPRQPTKAEFQKASQDFANVRRSAYLRAARAAGEPFYYFDCDLAAIIYIAAAERLKLPVYLVEVPGHNFVRWQSPEVSLNWDPNDAISKSDQQFAQMTGVTQEDQVLFGYLENRTRDRILSYWLVRRGQRKASDGKSAAALSDFRTAVKTAPEDLVAWNELAWLLATAPDAAIRNGTEAREVAEKLIMRSRRINWLETSAAACAEMGDFSRAIATEQEARRQAAAWLQATKRHDSLAGFDACLTAYGQKMTYATAAKSELVKRHRTVQR